MTSHPPAPLALTMGEPAGIGPDLAIQSWLLRDKQDVPAFCFIGPEELLQRRAKRLGVCVETETMDIGSAGSSFPDAIPCVAFDSGWTEDVGRPSTSSANDVVRSIKLSAELVEAGHAAGMVTNPIQKAILANAGFEHPGHTEFLGELSQSLFGAIRAYPIMMLASPRLRVIPVTVHIPLKDVPSLLTKDNIVRAALIADRELQDRFSVHQPRLAIAGLNPHAGEDGLMGTEDRSLVAPAVAELRDLGLNVVGPLPADTMFQDAMRENFDVAICMYHDQALIPVKTLDFDETVNVTLGLPFIRTSPDHGTALSLAGTGEARCTSLIAALKMAANMAAARDLPDKANDA